MEKHWSTHAEFIVILITLLGGFYILDGKIERAVYTCSARSDKLYEMYCETQKEIKQLHIDFITKEKRQNG